MNKTFNTLNSDDIRYKLAFQKGLLTLLKGVEPLFSPMIEKALKDLDDIMEEVR